MQIASSRNWNIKDEDFYIDDNVYRYDIQGKNIVYNDLISKGYEVYIGKTKKGEVDFVATKNKDLKYIQVSLNL